MSRGWLYMRLPTYTARLVWDRIVELGYFRLVRYTFMAYGMLPWGKSSTPASDTDG